MGANPLGFYGLLLQHRSGYPDKPAVITGRLQLSYAELVDRVDRVTTMLRDRGIGAADRVLWFGQNAHHVLELLVACARIGAMLCPANWRQSPDELEFILSDIDPGLVISQTAPPTPRDAWITVDEYEDLLPRTSPTSAGTSLIEPDADRGLLVLYTAAFTGRPAGAVLTENGLYLQGIAHIPVLQTRHDDVNLVATPLFHVLAWVALLPTLICGGTNVFVARPDAEEICRAIVDDGATTGPIMPPTAIQIAELNADNRYDLSGFRSALPVAGWQDMTTTGPTVGGYGQTETTGPVVLPVPGAQFGGPIKGRPSPIARVRIVDESGRDVPVGETGEIMVAGPTVTTGYWRRPDLNADRMTDGWWRTGDLGRRDPDGVVSFVGPKLRMIKTGGENVYPVEVEICLETHPDVSLAALIGRPDQTWGQLVTAVVVRRPDSSVDADTLIAYARQKLAAYKTPRIVHFVDEMPTCATGKDYAALDARFGGGNYPGMAEAARTRT
jgi:acyl-CoA synthetase (AMP-forming)/AMP-acid ligase II